MDMEWLRSRQSGLTLHLKVEEEEVQTDRRRGVRGVGGSSQARTQESLLSVNSHGINNDLNCVKSN